MKASTKHELRKPVILIADDDADCLNVLVKMLGALGYDAFGVRDGKAAVEAYNSMKNQIQFVILDMEMPFNGEKAYRKLRKLDKDVKILLISGYTEDSKVRALLRQGYCGFLEKPFNLNSLKVNITNITKS